MNVISTQRMSSLQSLAMKLERPLVVVLGSTAVGKSQLAIELATRLNGEIISADSMQVYKGLDIITNKVVDEPQNIKHHLISIIKPPAEYTVTDFQKQSLQIIDDLHRREKLPIIVGGTNYYIESILWDFLIHHDKSEKDGLTKRKNISEDSNDMKRHKLDLYEELMRVDPERANQLHPNNIRKISRSLQIFKESGIKHSNLIKSQQNDEKSSHLGGPRRFENVLLFWLKADQQILDERISKRVREMIDKGLLSEVSDFYEQYKQEKYQLIQTDKDNSSECNYKLTLYEEGLFQAIGFKEFHPYFTFASDDKVEKEKILKDCIENFKRVTIKYSKKQLKWVVQRFINRENSFDVFELDASDIKNWKKNVFEKALSICLKFLNNETIDEQPVQRTTVNYVDKHRKYVCDLCDNRIIIGEDTWEEHTNSRTHKRRLQKRHKEELL